MFSAPAEFVQLYIDFLLNKSIYRQFAAFYHGFHSVCSSDALMVRAWMTLGLWETFEFLHTG